MVGWARWLEQKHFTLCVPGGGLDPAPKAFEAAAVGSVPVVQHSDLDDAYRELGAVFVDEWDASALDENKLATWWAERRPVGAEEGAEDCRLNGLERLARGGVPRHAVQQAGHLRSGMWWWW